MSSTSRRTPSQTAGSNYYRAIPKMNSSHVYGERQHSADYSTIAGIQFQMEKLLTELDRQAPHYAKARTVSEFMSDRRKSALADAFCAIRDADPEESATAAEHRARASKAFKEKTHELIKDQLNAETAIATYHVLQTRVEVARSLLAIERAKLGL